MRAFAKLRRFLPVLGILLTVIFYTMNDGAPGNTKGGDQAKRNSVASNTHNGRHMVHKQTPRVKRQANVYQAKVTGPYAWIPGEIKPPDLTIDTGGRRCQEATRTIKFRASIIIDANRDTVSLVNFTIHTILQDSRVSIGQLVVVCDGTVSQLAARELREYLGENVPRSSFLHIQQIGRPRCQKWGAQKAREDVLVFLQAGVWVSKGWLDPMLDFLQDNSSSIATPRYDVVHLLPGRVPIYKSLYFVRTSILSWDLTSQLMSEYNIEDIVPTMYSASMRGDVWALTKSYWEKLGGFDEHLLDGAGAYAELALRVWLCGGTVRAVSCARVGIPVTTTIPVDSKEDLEYIVNKWMPQDIKRVSAASGEDLAITHAYKSVHRNLQCTMTMSEFMAFIDVDHILYDPVVDLHPERNKTMLLYTETGGCIMPLDNGNIVMDENCGGNDKSRAVFEVTPDGYLKNVVYQLCLTATSTRQVRMEACLDMELRQRWDLREDGTMINILLQYQCLQHQTHSRTGEQVAMLLPCMSAVNKDKRFELWQWIPVSASSLQDALNSAEDSTI